MAKNWVEPNPDHPRDPHTGEFTDAPGLGTPGDWAQRISDSISPTQQRREHVLDALNPETAYRRDLKHLFRQLEIDDTTAAQAIDEHMGYSVGKIQIPIDDYQLDSGLMNYVSLIDNEEADRLLQRIEELGFQDRFPGTMDYLAEIQDIFDGG